MISLRSCAKAWHDLLHMIRGGKPAKRVEVGLPVEVDPGLLGANLRLAIEAAKPLSPVSQAIIRGEIDPYDEEAMAAALQALPIPPTVAHVYDLDDRLSDALDNPEYALDNWAQDHPNLTALDDWQQDRVKAALFELPLDFLRVLALANLGAARFLGRPDLVSMTLETAAQALTVRYRLRHDPADLNRRIAFLEQALAAAPTGHDYRLTLRDNLSVALVERYQLQRDPADLDRHFTLLERERTLRISHTNLDRRVTRVVQADPDRRVALLEDALTVAPVGHPHRPSLLGHLGNALADRHALRGDDADLQRWIAVLEEALALIPAGHPDRPAYMNNLSMGLGLRFGLYGDPTVFDPAVFDPAAFGDPADLERGIALLEQALALTPARHPDRPVLRNHLGMALVARCALRGDTTDLDDGRIRMLVMEDEEDEEAAFPADLDRQVTLLEEELALTPAGPNRPIRLNNLAIALATRYTLRDDPADLEQWLAMLEQALALTPPGHLDRPALCDNLATALLERHRLRGVPADLDQWNPADLDEQWFALKEEALIPPDLDQWVTLLEESLARTPDGNRDRPAYLNCLGNALVARYRLHGDPTDLDRSVALLEQAIASAASGPDRPAYANNLGHTLAVRYRLHGDPADLDRGIALLEEALSLLPVAHPDRHGFLNNLANALDDRYTLRGDLADLDRGITLLEEVLALTPVSFEEASALTPASLKQSRGPWFRFRLKEAVALTPASYRDRPAYLNNLGNALAARYRLRGDPADIEQWVARLEEAVALSPLSPAGPDHPAHLALQNNLGNALVARYALRGTSFDLDRSIALLKETVSLTSAGHPDRPSYLDNLASALGHRYRLRGDPTDLDQPVALLDAALARTPAGPDRPGRLNNLAVALADRYALRRDRADLDREITLLEQALALTPSGHLDRPTLCQNLAVALRERHRLHGNAIDLDRSISLLEEATRQANTLALPGISRALGGLLLSRSAATSEHMRRVTLLRAARVVRRGTTALERMLIVAAESDAAALLDRHGALYDLLVTVHLHLATHADGTERPAAARRHRRLAYLAAERAKDRRAAALLATQAARPPRTTPEIQQMLAEMERLRQELALLDQQLAGSADARALAPPDVRAHQDWLSDAGPTLSPDTLRPVRDRGGITLDDRARKVLTKGVEAVWARLRDILDQINRTDDNYANVRGFAAPFSPEDVAAALPHGGALVLLYPLNNVLACFVIRSQPATGERPTVSAVSVPLQYADTNGTTLHGKAALAALVQEALPTGAPTGHSPLDGVLLKIARSLHPALSTLLPPPNPSNPPNLVLVPTGSLHRLPLHALPWPDYDRRLLDGYAISYATSADVLVLATRKPAASCGLAALAPGLPPERPIPGTLAEASAVARLAGIAPLLRQQATCAALLNCRGAAGVRWLLLATHGMVGGKDQSFARLLLSDEQGRPIWLSAAEILTLLDLEGPDMQGVEHLGLGACSTHEDPATAGDQLAGLLRALLYRGARSVQATLWQVDDAAAALVDVWTWEQLLVSGERDKAAALRRAVQRLRRVAGTEAAAQLRQMAVELTAVLPSDDPAHAQLEAMATKLAQQARPFRRTANWAPFVLHGAPHVAPIGPEATAAPMPGT